MTSKTTIDALVENWDGLAVISRHDSATGAWIFIALHDDRLGSAVGGTRMKSYPSPADALRDAMRLARGMTHKWAALDVDSGGGKGVLAIPGPLEGPSRRGLLRRYAGLIETLRGAFSTGRDLGTTDEDMLVLAEVTRHVHGVNRETGTTRDPGPFTAAGVLAAMRATLSAVFGSAQVEGRSVLIQGVGDVGEPLARGLAEHGARLLLSDLDTARVERLAGELGGVIVPVDTVFDTSCDVFAPCALGAVLDAETIPRLRCRAVVGSANNQLAEDADADRLHARGILYAPDFIANAGGALAFGLIHRGATDEDVIAARLRGIDDLLLQVIEEAGQRDESPLHAAQRRVERVLRDRKG